MDLEDLEKKISKYFCISIILLTQIIGKCCGQYEIFYLRGQYYGLGHPTGHGQQPGQGVGGYMGSLEGVSWGIIWGTGESRGG